MQLNSLPDSSTNVSKRHPPENIQLSQNQKGCPTRGNLFGFVIS